MSTTALQPLTFEGKNVRVITGEDGEPWFLLKDVCKVLGLFNTGMVASRIDEDQKSTINLIDGGPPRHIVSEIGLISVIMRSDKPDAKEFQRAAFDYIKSVGKHGMAMAGISSDNMARLVADPDSALLMELIRTRAQQLALVERTTEIERQLASIGDLKDSYTTIVGYFNRNGGTVDDTDAAILGKRASKLCREQGIDIGTVKSVRWGVVQSYPESVVAEAYEWLAGRGQS